MYKKIAIIAGHGKSGTALDCGAVAADGTTERSINVAIARKVVNLLGDYAVGFGIDEALTITEKNTAVNAYCKANGLNHSNSLLLSIHNDWRGASEGVMCYWLQNDNDSKAFAEIMTPKVATVGNRKAKSNKSDNQSGHGSLGILRYSTPTSILLEVDSLRADDNQNDGLELLTSEDGQNKIAQAIVEGVLGFTGWSVLREVSSWAVDSVEKAKSSGIIKNWDNPQEIVGGETLEQIFANFGVLKPTEKNVTKERLAVILDRLKLFD